MDEKQTEYDRGVAAGQVLSRLDSHDQHLSKINGSMDRVADELKKLNKGNVDLLLAVQHLGDAANSDRATVITTATALEKAEAARRDRDVSRWTPFERMLAILAVIVPVIALLVFILISTHVIK